MPEKTKNENHFFFFSLFLSIIRAVPNSRSPLFSPAPILLQMRASIPCQTAPAMGRAATLPALQSKRIKTTDGRRSLSRRRPSPSTTSSTTSAALPPFLADLPSPALAAAAATAAAVAASAATRFALLSAVDFAVATRLSTAVVPLRDPSSPSSDRKRALLLPSSGGGNGDGKGDGSRAGSRDLFLLPDRVGECVAGEKKKKEEGVFFFENRKKGKKKSSLLSPKKNLPPFPPNQSPQASTKAGGPAPESRAASPSAAGPANPGT